jgi:hypothetical protein
VGNALEYKGTAGGKSEVSILAWGGGVDFEFEIVQNTPYEQCQKIKRRSDIVIGDTTSGSYHLTDLEALSQGKPTFTYLDNRSQMVLQSLVKCGDLPFVNARLEEIDLPFSAVVKDEKLRKEIGLFSRQWIEKYYTDKDLVRFYVEAYTRLLNDEPLKRQKEFDFPDAKQFLFNTLYDLQWETRKSKLQIVSKPEAASKPKKSFGLYRSFRKACKYILPYGFVRLIQKIDIYKFSKNILIKDNRKTIFTQIMKNNSWGGGRKCIWKRQLIKTN